MTSKKFFYVLLGVLVVIVLVFGFGFRLGLNRINEEKSDIADVKARVAAIDEKLALTIATQTRLEQLSFVDTIAKEVLPQEKFQPELVSQLFNLAEENEINITSLTFTNQNITEKSGTLILPTVTQAVQLKDAPGVYTVPVTINSNGTYNDLINLLEDIETNRRKLQVQSIKITPLKSGSGGLTGRFTLVITLDVYVKP